LKLLSFRHRDRYSFGALTTEGIVDLGTDGKATLRNALTQLTIDALSAAASRIGPVIAINDVELLQPITDPDKILCVGVNYRSHAGEIQRQIAKWPALFVRFPGSQVAHGQPIIGPSLSTQFDYEGELAVVIGRRARHVSAARALDYIAGYSCFADNSARDFQRHTTQATPGKNFWRSGAFGPWLVTADEIPDPSQLTMVTRLNGVEMQRASLSELIFPIPDLIAYISSFTELLPGDVLATGTPDGIGAARNPPIFMVDGDVLEVEISKIGVLCNRVQRE
jgi:2-keto-4-pentenoate hydratase/2-oxohepta-3-ene-1,7-dioic acid hydratase in catechol pathway